MITQVKINRKLFNLSLLIIAVILFISGLLFNPAFVSKYLSSDGVIEKSTIIKIYIIDFFIVFSGVIVFFYSLITITKSSYAKKIDEKLKKIFITRSSYRVLLIGCIFFLLTISSGLWILDLSYSGKWQNAKGYEYFWITQGILSGNGYSIASCRRWMFVDHVSAYSCDEYFPTALEEPIYPAMMALSFKALGEYGKFAILIFHIISLLCTYIVIFYLGRKVFNFQTGVLATFILAQWPFTNYLVEGTLCPAIFAGLLVSVSAYLIFWCLERVSVQRGIALGFALGFSCLTFAPTLLFIPISVLLVFFSARPFRPVIWQTALAILLAACLVVCPWTLRNLLVFGKFVPVRTGLGITAHLGNPILAATFSQGSHACSDTLGPLWKAKDATEAIVLSSRSLEKRTALYKRSFDCIGQKAPDGYERFNEAERDKVYLGKTLDFIFSEPQTFAILTYHKFLSFFRGWSQYQSIIALFALSGAIVTLRHQKGRILTILVLAYSIPYLFGMPFGYRYRYPIEPLLLVMASYVPFFIISKFSWLIRRLVGHPIKENK